MNEELKQINYLNAMAEINSADRGGSYKQNEKEFRNSMKNYLFNHYLIMICLMNMRLQKLMLNMTMELGLSCSLLEHFNSLG